VTRRMFSGMGKTSSQPVAIVIIPWRTQTAVRVGGSGKRQYNAVMSRCKRPRGFPAAPTGRVRLGGSPGYPHRVATCGRASACISRHTGDIHLLSIRVIAAQTPTIPSTQRTRHRSRRDCLHSGVPLVASRCLAPVRSWPYPNGPLAILKLIRRLPCATWLMDTPLRSVSTPHIAPLMDEVMLRA
jgi:hypothetical protein